MSIILDAYNVLFSSHVLPDRYAELTAPQLGSLVEHAGLTRGTIYVVCDGSRKPDEWADPAAVQVEVLYAGKDRDADSLIEQLIDDAPSGKDLVVVSNDNRIQRAARRKRAVVLSSESFLHKLTDALRAKDAGPPEPEKPTGPFRAEPWMKKFGLDPRQPQQPPTDISSEADAWLKEFGLDHDDEADV
jgi:predicted RNA-binding protein with PIN domain